MASGLSAAISNSVAFLPSHLKGLENEQRIEALAWYCQGLGFEVEEKTAMGLATRWVRILLRRLVSAPPSERVEFSRPTAPYLIEPKFELVKGPKKSTETIYYLASTWNPYTVVLMKTLLEICIDPKGCH